MSAPLGLVLLAHGARDPAWAGPFVAVRDRIQRHRPELAIRLAFLEFMKPTLQDAGRELAELGCTTVDVVPLFFTFAHELTVWKLEMSTPTARV